MTLISSFMSWLLAGLALVAVLKLHLLPTLLAGMLMFVLVHYLAPKLQRLAPGDRAKVIVVGLAATLLVGAVTAAALGLVSFFKQDAHSLAGLLGKMATVLDELRTNLPWLADLLPDSATELQSTLVELLKDHASTLKDVTQEASMSVVHIMMGLIIGALISMEECNPQLPLGPLGAALLARVKDLTDVFRKIISAQVQISAINTVVTAIYLMLILPLCGIDLPFAKTMVAITFFAGLIPAIGNLISNTVIVLISLSHSPIMAGVSLGYLLVVHKLEYFINARIVGDQLQMKAWELLLAILVMEKLFGMGGIVAAPLIYAWVKGDLVKNKLV